MKFGSVCSGIGAPEQAWIKPLGWQCAFMSEIEAFPRAVLKFHHPEVPLHGDFTTIKADDYGSIDLLVGGTPCQSFSVAGLRGGLGDARGNLALEYLRLVDRKRPRWVVWENVPGVFSSLSHDAPDQRPPNIDLDGDNGPADGEEVMVTDQYDADESHAFACFLAGLSELGYGLAYRVFDAQFTRTRFFPRAVPQRRRRVFVVGYLGDWRPPAAVLFERESLLGHPPPRREAGQGVTGTLSARTQGGGGLGTDFDLAGGLVQGASDAGTLNANGKAAGSATQQDAEQGLLVAHTPNDTNGIQYGIQYGIRDASGVRRLTPNECARLQAFPDHFTMIPWRGQNAPPDGPMYKAYGNSMACNVLGYIGERIQLVEGLINGED